MTVTEEYLRILGSRGRAVYGKLCQAGHSSLILHIHGMTHSMNHMLEVIAADYFPTHGYDHYRIGLYPREKDAFTLAESTLSSHVEDIDRALQYFSPRYERIYISAHSLAALCVLILNPPKVSALSLWDPAFDVSYFWDKGSFLTPMPEYGQYQMNYGNVFVIGEALVDEISRYPHAKCIELSQKIKIPTQLLIAEQSIFDVSAHSTPAMYQQAIQAESIVEVITQSNHTFSNRGNPKQLMKLTQQWFDRF